MQKREKSNNRITNPMTTSMKYKYVVNDDRLLRPLAIYQDQYCTLSYEIKRRYILMVKQHNRTQDGIGWTYSISEIPHEK